MHFKLVTAVDYRLSAPKKQRMLSHSRIYLNANDIEGKCGNGFKKGEIKGWKLLFYRRAHTGYYRLKTSNSIDETTYLSFTSCSERACRKRRLLGANQPQAAWLVGGNTSL